MNIEKNRFEAFGIGLYGLLIGFIVTIFFDSFGQVAFLLLIPLYIRTFAISVFLKDIFENMDDRMRYPLSLTPLIGVILSLHLFKTGVLLYTTFSFLMGILLYILVRDMIPLGREGKTKWFLVGIIVLMVSFLLFQM